MSGKHLIAYLLAVSVFSFGSFAVASSYGQDILPDPYIEPMPGVEPRDPGSEPPPITMPVEPMPFEPPPMVMPVEPMPFEPPPVVMPVAPKAEQPPRSDLPANPPGVDLPVPPHSDLPIELPGNIKPVAPMIDPRPVTEPVVIDQYSRVGRNVLPPEIGDEPGWKFFPVEPIVIDPPGNTEPVAPVVDPRSMPMPMVVDELPGDYFLGPNISEPREEPRKSVPSPALPNPNRMPFKPGVAEPNLMVADELPGDYSVVGPNITEPREEPRQRNPLPVDPNPKRMPFKPGVAEPMQRDGVESEYTRRIVIPIIAPNPLVNQSARVSFQAGQVGSGRIELSVIDLVGKVVMRSELQARRDGIYEVDFGRLSNGAYLLRMSAPGVESARKLVVQR